MPAPGLRFDDAGNGLSLALFSWGVTFDMKRRRRDAALTSHGISSGGTPGRANAEARGRGPAAAMADLLPAADNPHICSGKSLVSGLVRGAAAQLRTHSPGGAVDRRCPRLLTRFWPENGKLRGHACLENPHARQEMRAGYQR